MDLQLQGKIAIVTGSTAGIGKAIAASLAAEGARVIINGRSAEKVEQVAGELRAHGDVHGVAADLCTAEGVKDLVAGAERVGPVDILVNNFGTYAMAPFDDISDDDWAQMFNANVMSGVRTARAVLGGMRERNWGRVIFVSSESGINIPTDMIHYGAAKAAQLAVARGLAKSLRGTGVTVNSVLPGPTWTENTAALGAQIAEQQGITLEELKKGFVKGFRPSSIIERFTETPEVAGLVTFLASPLASAITGAAQRVDGGVVDTCF